MSSHRRPWMKGAAGLTCEAHIGVNDVFRRGTRCSVWAAEGARRTRRVHDADAGTARADIDGWMTNGSADASHGPCVQTAVDVAHAACGGCRV